MALRSAHEIQGRKLGLSKQFHPTRSCAFTLGREDDVGKGGPTRLSCSDQVEAHFRTGLRWPVANLACRPLRRTQKVGRSFGRTVPLADVTTRSTSTTATAAALPTQVVDLSSGSAGTHDWEFSDARRPL